MHRSMRILGSFLLFLGGCLLAAGASWAGPVDIHSIGARATSLGGAYSANAEGPFAAYYNPAGLTQTESPVTSAGIMVLNPDLEVKNYEVENSGKADLGPTDEGDKSDNIYPPHLGFAMPINSKWSVGVAAYVPFGLHLKWEDNPNKNPMSYNAYENWYQREVVTPTVAYKVNDQLSLGLGVSLGRSEAGVYRNVYGLTPYGMDTAFETEMTDSFNYSANLGLMYKPTQEWSIGLTYRSQADADFDGELEVKGDKTSATFPHTIKDEYDVSMDDVDHPDQVQFGARYQPYETLSLEADVVWTRWSMVDEQTVEFDDKDDPFIQAAYEDGEEVFERDWDNTWQIRMGTEWRATDMITLRGGYFYDPSCVPDDTFDGQWPDTDKQTFSLGAGFDITQNWTVDTVLQYTLIEERSISGESENLNDSYNYEAGPLSNEGEVSLKADGEIWGYGLTVSYTF